MAVWTTRSPRGTNARVSHMKHDAATSTIVAHGLRSNVSVRRPGIRATRSRRRRRRGLGPGIVPPRSSFGARLRSRVPQYGHSVMYGDTSEPQLLHTTKRSGPLAIPPSRIRAAGGHGRRSSRVRVILGGEAPRLRRGEADM